jgi:hypothetical protein
MNSQTRRVLEAWTLGKKNEFVFYNCGTGKPFVDLSAGLALACQKAGVTGVTWHTLHHYAEFRTMPGQLDHSAITTPQISVPVILAGRLLGIVRRPARAP